jgi:hypothetical protein
VVLKVSAWLSTTIRQEPSLYKFISNVTFSEKWYYTSFSLIGVLAMKYEKKFHGAIVTNFLN